MIVIQKISQADLTAFHTAHFSSPCVDHFAKHFLGPVDEDYQEYLEGNEYPEEDDGLGYYDDGVKRTLTDEQIAIFRHSEIEALLRERRHIEEMKGGDDSTLVPELALTNSQVTSPTPQFDVQEEGEVEDEEQNDDQTIKIGPVQASKRRRNKSNKKLQKAQLAKEKGWFKQNVKPDLRKRTWDKVETGVGNLYYDEEETGHSAAPSAPQRRRISYDD